ncbi:MAG: hypothetical protein KGJ14_07110 [Nitrospirota bacterium]|nr:hypothetical protein [Nitrospirota bacterium]
MVTRIIVELALMVLPVAASALAEESPGPVLQVDAQGTEHTIVQIGGRMCEYHRSEVEGALRQFEAVRQIEFLNNHGTVLVKYRSGAMSPEQLAEAVERALAMGWGCKAWVERGG